MLDNISVLAHPLLRRASAAGGVLATAFWAIVRLSLPAPWDAGAVILNELRTAERVRRRRAGLRVRGREGGVRVRRRRRRRRGRGVRGRYLRSRVS